MNDSEVWKDVAGYEGIYKVSNKGNVHSVERRDTFGRKWGGCTLRPSHNNTGGYLSVELYKNGISEKKRVHRLVAEVFIPNPNNYLEINHKDENNTNNHVENLEWCTSTYNNNYGTKLERIRKKVRAVNIKTGEATTFSSTAEAGHKGYDQGAVSKACRGVYYGGNLYKGHKWSYEEENK